MGPLDCMRTRRPDKGEIGKRIARARKALGMSGRAMERAASLNTGDSVKIEAGKDGLEPRRLAAIAEALGVSMFWLATGREPNDATRPCDPRDMVRAVAAALLDDAGLAEIDALAENHDPADLCLEVWRLHHTHPPGESSHVRRVTKKSIG